MGKGRVAVVAAAAATLVGAGALVVLPTSSAGASKPLASAVLRNADGAEVGQVLFSGQGRYADRVVVELQLPPGAPGLDDFHGFHVHTVGDCTPPFTSAGGHWSMEPAVHGDHTGDLPSVLVGADGTARLTTETHRFDVNQLFDEDGSAVILHNGRDNFANVPLEEGKYEDPNDWFNAEGGTAATGDAGGRYACGTVEARSDLPHDGTAPDVTDDGSDADVSHDGSAKDGNHRH